MPWPEKTQMALREEFTLRALEPGANLSELCREYGISRKTGYKWKDRFQTHGVAGLADMSRRPHSAPLRASGEVVLAVIDQRRVHPRWGPKKLRAVLARSTTPAELPSVRTVARILERADLVLHRRRAPVSSASTVAPSPQVSGPNDLWTLDFKGWWRTSNGQRAEPLTVRDAFSRYVLCADLLEGTSTDLVRRSFEALFERFGLPLALQMDNGSPFANTRSPGGLTRLSAWWVSLGIKLIRGRPAHPQDNGAHERMHLDMRFDVEDVGAADLVGQREALARWMLEFNHQRPHEALEMAVPASRYQVSTRRYLGQRKAWYPAGFELRQVNRKGYVKIHGHAHYVTLALSGYAVGVRMCEGDTAELRFYDVDLGTLDLAA